MGGWGEGAWGDSGLSPERRLSHELEAAGIAVSDGDGAGRP